MGLSGPIARGLLASVPGAKNASDAVLWYAELLIAESGISQPPFQPHLYADLRRVKSIVDKDMKVEGRLVPVGQGFLIEVRKDRSRQRKNFSCAHELAHTFFFEAVPEMKRSMQAAKKQIDNEEELLCNLAAAELLMPHRVFSRIARDFLPSPSSLIDLSSTFESSITSTALRVMSLGLWNCSFVLWSKNDKEIAPSWLLRQSAGLTYRPNLSILNPITSSVYHTLKTGESTSVCEWLYLDESAKRCHISSVRLSNPSKVLSCIVHGAMSKKRSLPAANLQLPLSYACECDGTHWRLFSSNGHTYAARCLAKTHTNFRSAQ